MKAASLALTAALGLATLTGAALADDTEERQVDPFRGVTLKGAGDLTIEVGGEQRVSVTADDLSQVKTRVTGNGILEIVNRGSGGLFGGGNDLSATLSVPSLVSLTLSGSGDATATGIDAETFDLRISGSGEADLAGRCGTGSVTISGSGDVNARSLECRDIRMDISGSGDADVYATGTVRVEIAGSGDVDVYGGGRVTRLETSGSGDVTVHDAGDSDG